jgi:hypothetical protein
MGTAVSVHGDAVLAELSENAGRPLDMLIVATDQVEVTWRVGDDPTAAPMEA